MALARKLLILYHRLIQREGETNFLFGSPPPAEDPAASEGPAAIGAANAGTNPFASDDDDAAPSLRQISTPVMVISTVAAFLALTL